MIGLFRKFLPHHGDSTGSKRPGRGTWIFVGIAVIATSSAICLLVSKGLPWQKSPQGGRSEDRFGMELTFQRVYMSQFVVWGDFPPQADDKKDDGKGKLTVLHVKAAVDVRLPVGNEILAISDSGSSRVNARYCIIPPSESVSNSGSTGDPGGGDLWLPFTFRVEVQEKDIEHVLDITDVPRSDESASDTARYVAIAGSAVGGLLGAVLGNAASQLPGVRKYKVLAVAGGAAVGAAIGGSTSYFITRSVLKDLSEKGQAPPTSQAMRDELASRAGEMMVVDLLRDPTVAKALRAKAEDRVRDFVAASRGIEPSEVTVEFVVGANAQ